MNNRTLSFVAAIGVLGYLTYITSAYATAVHDMEAVKEELRDANERLRAYRSDEVVRMASDVVEDYGWDSILLQAERAESEQERILAMMTPEDRTLRARIREKLDRELRDEGLD